jgi:hypothetical protein
MRKFCCAFIVLANAISFCMRSICESNILPSVNLFVYVQICLVDFVRLCFFESALFLEFCKAVFVLGSCL